MLSKRGLHEHTFNVALARALRNANANWGEAHDIVTPEATQVHGSFRIDIEVKDLSTMPKPVAIETAYGGDRDRDALARFENLGDTYDTAISVNIPDVFKEMNDTEAEKALIEGKEIGYALLQRTESRLPALNYISGSARDLASLIRVTSIPKKKVEQVAENVAKLINQASEALEKLLGEHDRSRIVKEFGARSDLSTFRTLSILWMDAMLVQTHLRTRLGKEIDTLNFEDLKPTDLAKSWDRILKRNWRSIFSPAVKELRETANSSIPAVQKALNHLNEARVEIERSQIGEQVNVGGELFQKINEDRKTSAAFYTTPPTAELLSTLLIREQDRDDWSNPELFKSVRIADLACGTGTLIRAAYHRVRELHEAHGGDLNSVAELHKHAMEDGIRACDISPIAAHLTNSGMALIGRGKPYGVTGIGWVKVGNPEKKGLSTGSLELLKKEYLLDWFSKKEGGSMGGEPDDNMEGSIFVQTSGMDYVIMNPPYSRTRKGQAAFSMGGLTEKERKLCQDRWTALRKNEATDAKAGMASSFLCIGAKKVKPGGRIGYVLPLTAAFAGSWRKTRKMLETEFKEIVLINHAGGSGGKQSLSADTHMGEMLLLATRKRTIEENDPSTSLYAVSLRHVPLRLGESREFARAIQRSVTSLREEEREVERVLIGGDQVGQVIRFESVGGNPWDQLGVRKPELSISASKLADEGLLCHPSGDVQPIRLGCGMSSIEKVFTVGPTHHSIGHPLDGEECGAFQWKKITDASERISSHLSMWVADQENQQRLIVQPTHTGLLVKAADQERIKDYKSNLHYARGMSWTSQKLLAATTPTIVHGGRAWTTLKHTDPRLHKVFSLWANSLFGMLVHWTRGNRSQPGRAPAQVNDIRKIPTPDFAQLPDSAIDRAVSRFDDLSKETLLRACQSHADDVRQKIDDAVIELFDLPNEAKDIVNLLGKMWCLEPTVHGGNLKALAKLREKRLID